MELMHSKDPTDFTRPKIIRIGNGFFRNFNSVGEKSPTAKALTSYTDNEDAMINCVELDDDVEIKVTRSGKFLVQFHVAPYFFAGIIGTKGLKKQSIESDTNTHIKVPRHGEVGDIVVTGNTERDVISAKTRINMIVLQMRDRHQVTHFVSIPLISEQIRNNFDIFKGKLLNGPPLRGVDESIFQSPEKLHLTIATFVLLDEIEIETAIKIMHECKDEVIEPLFRNAGKLKIVLEGIEIMNDDPTCVDVLYGKVKLNVPKYNKSFQKMADQIVEHFSRRGIIRKQYENVKLHCTLMNSRYRQQQQQSDKAEGSGRFQRESFDCSFILDKYRNFYFGEVDFTNVHLSIRFSKGDDGFYEHLTTIPVD